MDNSKVTNKPLTDEERREFAEKLDRDLDKFIEGLEKKPYTDGWPEDNWEEVRLCQVSNTEFLFNFTYRKWKNTLFS